MTEPFLIGPIVQGGNLIQTTPPTTERQKDMAVLINEQKESPNTRGMKYISQTLKRLCKMINGHLSPQAIIEYSNRLTTRLSSCHDVYDYIEVIAQVTEDLESIQSLIQNYAPEAESPRRFLFTRTLEASEDKNWAGETHQAKQE